MIKGLFRFLASLRPTLPLLFTLALGAMAGTVIPQRLSGTEYEALYGATPALILKRLGLFDVYHSWWFIALLGLLAINLLFCSYRRLPALWRAYREPAHTPSPNPGGRYFTASLAPTGMNREELSQAIEVFLANRFPRFRCVCLGGTPSRWEIQVGAWTRLAVFVIHGALLLILAGGMAGLLWGFQGYAVIREGETVRTLQPSSGGDPLPLGFGLRCDDFSVAFHEDSHLPKEFKSLVSVIEGEQAVLERQPITVNSPLTHRGIRFHQSSYGPAAPAQVTLRLWPRSGTSPFEVALSEGETAALPGGGTLHLLRFSPTFRDFGPTALAAITPPGGPTVSRPVFQNHPDLGESHSFGDYHLDLVGFQQPYYTVLLAGYDPGVALVWIGFVLLTSGLAASLFSARWRFCVSITPEGIPAVITLSGEGRHPFRGTETFFTALTQELEKELTGER